VAAAAAPPDPLEAVKRAQRELVAQKDAWRKEREEAQTKWQQEQAAHKARLDAADANEKRLRNLKRDPLGSLKELGVPWEEVQEAALQDGKPGPGLMARDLEDRMEARIREIEAAAQKRIQELEEQSKTYREQQEQGARQAWHSQTAQWVAAQADKYELINLYGLQANVGQEIERQWEQTGERAKPEEVAAKLEEYLQGEVRKLEKTKFFQSITKPAEKPVEVSESEGRARNVYRDIKGEVKREQAPTLTNDLTPSTTTTLSESLTPAQRWEAAKKQYGL
jgi:hypothetical protein